ncbi:hypothetical protein GJB61_08520 [Paenibacillus sp. LC-T2]|uniref:Uncharacterized protein n=2 Tax=Paenibacillus monticola TaxID=2666075 RepID=A0A7X2H3R2_9BACL|nr:hypothetical protein [Paenibacillus monticola]
MVSGAVSGIVSEAFDAFNDFRDDGKQSLGERIATVGINTVITGVGDVAITAGSKVLASTMRFVRGKLPDIKVEKVEVVGKASEEIEVKLKEVEELRIEVTGKASQGQTERYPTKLIDPIEDKYIIDQVAEVRGGLSNRYKEDGNFAYAEVNITGVDKTDFYAHSGIHDASKNIPGTGEFSFKPDQQIFKATEAPDKVGNIYLRDGDTEYKILNDLAKRIGDNPNATGKIKLFSEKDTCGSCNIIIQQFNEKYPNIKIEVIHNGDVPILPKT